MHQVCYIDIDEEITSIIDRLRKSKAREVYFIVPQRSLILQSTVSLKLLKREANKLGKQISVVTQDSEGRMRAEKSGIYVLENISDLGIDLEADEGQNFQAKNAKIGGDLAEISSRSSRVQDIGSDEFFESPTKNKKEKNEIKIEEREFGMDSFYVPQDNEDENENKKRHSKEKVRIKTGKEKELEEFYENKRTVSVEMEKKNAKIPISGKMKKITFLFIFLGLIIVAGLGIYLIVPKATISITMREEQKSFDVEAKGDISASHIDFEKIIIPARIIEAEDSLVSDFTTSGKNASNQKAKGSVTIYNEFSSASQSLVSATRILSTDGKLFRLVKGVTVPGTTEVNGSVQPGAIKADVIADAPGEEYNIGPSSFTIPGFQGSAKYEKFYAKSTEAMLGGGSKSTGGLASVSETDIANARKKTENDLTVKMEKGARDKMKEGEIFLKEAEEKTVIESFSSVRIGEVSDNFKYTAKEKLKLMVFLESDLKLAIKKNFEAKKELADIDQTTIELDYGGSTPNFGAGTIEIKAFAKFSSKSEIDREKLKQELLGKNVEQVKELIGSYSKIKNIDIEFWPDFLINKIPSFKQRVEIIIN
jgi:hypothetical protein